MPQTPRVMHQGPKARYHLSDEETHCLAAIALFFGLAACSRLALYFYLDARECAYLGPVRGRDLVILRRQHVSSHAFWQAWCFFPVARDYDHYSEYPHMVVYIERPVFWLLERWSHAARDDDHLRRSLGVVIDRYYGALW